MPRNYLALDIETAKVIPGNDFDWRSHRPLGITCIASQTTQCDEPRVWMSRTESGSPAPRMSQADVAAFVNYVNDAANDGFVPLSWNGLGFDFDILAEESNLIETCQALARNHVDMMFHVFCEKGFPVALKNAARGLGVKGKLDGVEGIDAPSLWKSGQHDLVTRYVAQDVRTTLAIAREAESRRKFAWKTRKGTISSMPLPDGWMTVEAASKLPLPDTSWMQTPAKRNDFLSWTHAKTGN